MTVPNATLLDHLVGAQQDRHRQVDAQRRGGLLVDDHDKARGRLDRHVGRLGALENAPDVVAGATEYVAVVRAVAEEAAELRPPYSSSSRRAPCAPGPQKTMRPPTWQAVRECAVSFDHLPRLFDYPVRTKKHCLRQLDAERLRRLQVDHQFEQRRLLDRDVGRFGTFEHLVDQVG